MTCQYAIYAALGGQSKLWPAMLAALEGSGKPLIATSGLAMLAPGETATEAHNAARHGRGETEGMVRDAASRGLKTAVIVCRRLHMRTVPAGSWAPSR